MKRRTFTQATAGLGVAAHLARPLSAMPKQSEYLDSIGLKLLTVGNQMEQDSQKTLQAVADASIGQSIAHLKSLS